MCFEKLSRSIPPFIYISNNEYTKILSDCYNVKLDTTSKSYKLCYISNYEFLMQQPTDQSVGLMIGILWKYLNISLIPVQYLDISLVADKIYCPRISFDLPTQSVTYL